MSELSEIQTESKAKRKLKGVNFQFKGAHIAYTHEDQGGAASGLNNPVLLKASELNKELTQSQKDILEEIGEEFTPLDKSLTVDTHTPSSASVELGEDNQNDKGNKPMADNADILKKLEQLEQDNKILKAEKAIASYEFDAELSAGVASAMANLDEVQVASITKAFDGLLIAKEEAVTKAKESVVPEETELSKSLNNEQGNDSKVEEEVELTMAEQIIKSREALTNKGAK